MIWLHDRLFFSLGIGVTWLWMVVSAVDILSGDRKKVKSLSHVQLFATPWTVAHQAPPSIGFSRQEYCESFIYIALTPSKATCPTSTCKTVLYVLTTYNICSLRASQSLCDKESTCQCKKWGFNPWVRKIPWGRKQQPTPVFLAWEIPWTEEPGGIQSMGSQRVRHDSN